MIPLTAVLAQGKEEESTSSGEAALYNKYGKDFPQGNQKILDDMNDMMERTKAKITEKESKSTADT